MNQRHRDRGSTTAVVALVVAVIAIPFAVWGIRLATAAPEGKVGAYEQKESANNRIFAQQHFEEMAADIRSTQAKIARAAKDPHPTEEEETILGGLQQYCSSIVGTYNAAARSYTTEQFRAADLPESYDPSTDCEPAP